MKRIIVWLVVLSTLFVLSLLTLYMNIVRGDMWWIVFNAIATVGCAGVIGLYMWDLEKELEKKKDG